MPVYDPDPFNWLTLILTLLWVIVFCLHWMRYV